MNALEYKETITIAARYLAMIKPEIDPTRVMLSKEDKARYTAWVQEKWGNAQPLLIPRHLPHVAFTHPGFCEILGAVTTIVIVDIWA